MAQVSRAGEFEAAIRAGGVVLFPSDTVYGLAVAADNPEPLYALKGRARNKPAALMFFELAPALAGVPERTAAAMRRLLPGAVTVVLPDGRGIRVVDVPELRGVTAPVLQSSANRSGGPDARRLADVDPFIRDGVSLEIDGGELPGRPSTVVDLRHYEAEGEWAIRREGAVPAEIIAAALDAGDHFDPVSYAAMIREEIPAYDELQAQLVLASAPVLLTGARDRDVATILELGSGTGETAAVLLAAHPHAALFGIDVSEAMLEAARRRVPRAHFQPGRLQDPLPTGPFDLAASALAVHHLTAYEKQDLFRRVARALVPGGRFVLADVVKVDDPAIPLTPGYDKPDTLDDLTHWLSGAGFIATSVGWQEGDLAVILAIKPASVGVSFG
jgi:tRNA A37 threonylcarbamoyladenosine synthetase subunit TsaC/SUA5/YrdC